jgi:hypothetical protein
MICDEEILSQFKKFIRRTKLLSKMACDVTIKI